MIYLDNAATSWPKPEAVYAAVDHYQREIGIAADGRDLAVVRVNEEHGYVRGTAVPAAAPEAVAAVAAAASSRRSWVGRQTHAPTPPPRWSRH